MEILENRDEWVRTYQENWLAHHKETGEFNWKIYNRPTNTSAPSGPAIDLSQSRLALITSSGAYLPVQHEAYDAPHPYGDYTIRRFPSSTPLDALAFAHTHYDHAAVDEDPQVLVPLRHLDALVDEGMIGEMAPSVISFMGYQPDVSRVLDETIPLIVAAAKEEDVRAALLVPA